MNNFNHLHLHNEFSLLDGLSTADEWAKQAKELGFQYLGLTNHGNIDGIIKHQQACLKNNIIPISGVEFYIVPNPEIKEKENKGHITVWIKNKIGFQNVCKMLTQANLYFFYGRPRIGFDLLLTHCEGLCVGTACSSSFLHLEGGLEFFNKLHDKIQDDLYLEVMPHDFYDQYKTNNLCLNLSKQYNIKLIGTMDAHYILQEDWETHDVLLACQTKKKISDPDRWRFTGKDYFLCSYEYIYKKFQEQNILYDSEIKECLNNTLEIAEKCKDFRLEKQRVFLPIPPQFEGQKEEEVLRKLCEIGFKEKFLEVSQEYRDRFEYELSVVKDFNVIRYFLIAYDVMNYCRQNRILTGPGRGSSSGSLISYLLGITKIDPIPYGLLFERFLNPGRKGALPDIDTDFEDRKRNQVVAYLKNIYGENHIANISTYLKIKDRGTIRDICRVFDIPLHEADKFAKSMTGDFGEDLKKPEGVEFQEKYPHVVKHILKLTGTYKAYGRHASAFLLSPEDLSLGTKGALAEREGQLVVCFDGNDCEYQGLLKLDILGLSTLSVMSMCCDLIKENHNKIIDLEKINLNDKKVYKEISKGNNIGCFQIGTYALGGLIRDMGVENILHIMDANACVRPGAADSGATARYIERKHGKPWDKKHPVYEEITKETYGEAIFQEQIIFILNKIAGFSLAQADSIRKIIGKKMNVQKFQTYKEDFIKGCISLKTLSQEEAEQFWHELEYSANYLFNKSHALAYAIIGYQTAWLKYYFPNEFICASLTYGNESKEKLLGEAQRLNLKIVPPKIGISNTKEWKIQDGKLFVPFIECKGVGPASLKIIEKISTSQGITFFDEDKPKIPNKLNNILTEIGAFDESIPETIDSYFDLGIVFRPDIKYNRLYSLFANPERYLLTNLLEGNIKNRFFGKEIKNIEVPEKLISCIYCELRRNCPKPVLPSIGQYNIVIAGEAPWTQEIEKGIGFVGDSGAILWNELAKYSFTREMFYITNLIKCKVRTPTKKQIQTCADLWFKGEMEKVRPFVVLVFGNTAMKYFKDQDKGIYSMNGKTKWNEEFGCWLCYSVHPASCIYNEKENKYRFQEGIKNFVNVLENVGGFY